MKRNSLIIFLLAWLFMPVGVRSQDTNMSDIYRLADSVRSAIPYYDSENHISLMHVLVNSDRRFLRLTFDLEVGQLVKEADWYLDYVAHHLKWDFSPLANKGFELRVAVNLPKTDEKASKTAAFTFYPSDLQQVFGQDLDVQARVYLAGLAKHINSTLPHLIGDGEIMYSCHYDEDAKVMTTTYQYTPETWPEIKQYITQNIDIVRKDRAMALATDTVNHLAFVAYKGGVTLRHVYRGQGTADSVVMTISPWMWRTVFEQGSGDEADAKHHLLVIAGQVKAQCPIVADANTTLTDCTFDTLSGIFSYTYQLTPQAAKQLSAKDALKSLRHDIEKAFHSNQGRKLAQYIISAHAQIQYTYISSSAEPLKVVFTSDELKKIINPKY